MKINFELLYSDFSCYVMTASDKETKEWTPNEGEYKKNLFGCYIFRGSMSERRADNNEPVSHYEGEIFVNSDVTLQFPTLETFDDGIVWLCFSSWKPITAVCYRLDGDLTIDAGVGVFCVLGSFEFEDKKAEALNYVKPRDVPLKISGDAKVLLLNYGKFVNQPIT